MPFPHRSFSRRAFAAAAFAAAFAPGGARARTIRLVALGDSLTAGYGLAPSDALPAQLERRLRARGHDVVIANAGVSGDTAAGGRERLDWSVPAETDGVIVALGANDALRGLPPAETEAALDAVLARLSARRMPVLLAGFLAPRSLGPAHVAAFDAIYPRLAARHGALLYPFILEGVATDRALNQADGLHPNARGVAVIVERLLPQVEALLARAAAR